jgi:thioredoxin reductase
MGQDCEVAIIGAGPYGLSLAAHLKARGIDHRVFGKALDTWARHMPRTMKLKSQGLTSNLSAPGNTSTLKSWAAENGVPDHGAPIVLDDFLGYADTFRRRHVPNLEEALVTSLVQAPGGFLLVLDTGERVVARRVVIATGLSHSAFTPGILAQLPAELVSHSYDHRDVTQFRNKNVAIVGAGASAIDLAHLLADSGANPRVIARVPEIAYDSAPDRNSLLFSLQNPPSAIGRGWSTYFCAGAPLLFYRLPKHLKERAIEGHLNPAAGWFMRDQVEGRIAMSLGRVVEKAEARGGRVALTLWAREGFAETLHFDHVIAATGYRADMARLPFLTPDLRSNIALAPGGSPFVFDNFETSVDGLYAIGLAAMEMFGPLMGYMAGAEFVAPRLAAHLERQVTRATVKRAA